MRAKDRETLMNTRAQAKLVARMRERMGEERGSGLRAIRMDGMPKGSLKTGGLDAGMIRQEEMQRILAREEAVLKRMERKARLAMEGMKPEVYAFCAVYYIGGMGLLDAAEAIDRSERQCKRYKIEVESGQEL